MRPGPSSSIVRLFFWAHVRSGLSIEEAAVAAGVPVTTAGQWFRNAGGVKPPGLLVMRRDDTHG